MAPPRPSGGEQRGTPAKAPLVLAEAGATEHRKAGRNSADGEMYFTTAQAGQSTRLAARASSD